MPKWEPVIALNGETSYFYALRVLRGRFIEGEEAISKLPIWSVRYARFIMKERFKKAEKNIAKDPEQCYEYFKHVIKKKLPQRLHSAMVLHSYNSPSNHFVNKYFKELK